MTEERDGGMVLGCYFTGREPVAWQHPTMCDLLDIESFIKNITIAEDSLFHFQFMAEALNLPETTDGEVEWFANNGRHDVMTAMTAMAAATERIGLVATVNSTWNEPYDVARKLATLDILSGGRTGWNLVTSQPPTTIANFGHRGYDGYDVRYESGGRFLREMRRLWNAGGDVDIAGSSTSWPTPPQQDGPLVFTASVSAAGAEFSAGIADGVFMIPQTIDAARAHYDTVKQHLPAYGRDIDDLRVLAGMDVVTGDTHDEAEEKFNHYLDLEITDRDVIFQLERLWMRDLKHVDPHGPLPDVPPDREKAKAIEAGALTRAQGMSIRNADEYVAYWTRVAREWEGSCREFVKQRATRSAFVGTPAEVADDMTHWYRTRAADGFIVQPHVVPLGIEEFTERVVPLLQERGVFRAEVERGTLAEVWRRP